MHHLQVCRIYLTKTKIKSHCAGRVPHPRDRASEKNESKTYDTNLKYLLGQITKINRMQTEKYWDKLNVFELKCKNSNY